MLSPTRFLADRLVEGGIDADKLEVLPYGAETRALEALPRPSARDAGSPPLRFGYLGGVSKHKGVHVLVDAFASLTEPAELSIWGGSSDDEYVKLVKRRAERAGARWRGVYGRNELARCLEQIDVAVVPSIWVENYPFVIREAFAAGRPVLASRVGALPESVRDGVDGLLFEPGDPRSLAAAMERLIREPALLDELVRNIEEVKGIEAQAGELVSIYERLVERATADEASTLPEHLRARGERYAELEALPLRQLFREVLARLGPVEAALSGETRDGDAPPLAALATHSRAQVLLRDLKHEADWLRDSVASLREEVEWRKRESLSQNDEAEWLRRTAQALKTENDWLRGQVEEKAREAEWIEQRATSKEREADWLRELYEEKTREAEWQSETIEGLSKERDWLKECVAKHEHVLAQLRERGRLVNDHVERARELLRGWHPSAAAPDGAPITSPVSLTGTPAESAEVVLLDELASFLANRNEELADILRELGHRRSEMKKATAEAAGFLRVLFAPTRFGRRVAGWKRHEVDE